MNFLAHIYLSPPGEDAMLGSLLGDFVKGPLDHDDVVSRYGPQITNAIALHRRIDSYTDTHPVVVASRNRVSRQRRRFAGVMIDVFYDHFLARYWQEFHDEPLEDFTSGFYEILLRRHAELPERLQHMAPSMAQLDWLGSYAQVQSIDTALNRMSQRLRRRDNALLDSAEELVENYIELENDFRRFMPEVCAFARLHGDS
ncbi:MAG: ACP phosphodiesterase [Burkholderiales bacterium]